MKETDIQKFITADSLHYLSMEGMYFAMKKDEQSFCAACFSGSYPIEIESLE